MRILITGVTGFVGPHLAQHLAAIAPEAEIWGTVWAAEKTEAPPRVHAVEADLTEISTLVEALEAARPEIVFHLAAASSVASSWDRPGRFLEVNAVGTVNLLEAMRSLGMSPRVVVSSSAEIYGPAPADSPPICESAPLRPVSPYAASKAAQDLLAAQYFFGFGLPTVRLRLFHHTGPGRPPQFVASSFARQIARIERGLEPPRLAVGNLEAVRDFTDVRDVARAYWSAAVEGRPGEAYNVCSGRGVRIAEVLDMLVARAGIELEVVVDPSRLRAADIPHMVGDAELFYETTGWKPEISLERTLGDLLNWWRGKLES
ncbi:MAG: GDP-mannose 4,6-dehydratase [Acidobacteria bacterium]|nr:GDP-mannose 4,6-dehydratase [Acidobacteriota bacterium]